MSPQFTAAALAIQITALMVMFVLLIRERLRSIKRKREEWERNTMGVALLSHRLRTPLSSIKWYTELLTNEEFGKLKIAQLELLHDMQNSIEDAIGILNSFLDASNIEQKEVVGKAVTIDLWQHIDHVLAHLKPLVEERKHALKLAKGQDHPLVFMDPIAFHEIFELLVSNAIVYTPQGGSITISAAESDASIIVSVQDTGIGMTQEELQLLYTKFFRGTKAKTMNTSGNGLGLYLAKHLVTRSGGTIRCESKENVGTVFNVTLPKGPSQTVNPAAPQDRHKRHL